jgi:hypothetical protein
MRAHAPYTKEIQGAEYLLSNSSDTKRHWRKVPHRQGTPHHVKSLFDDMLESEAFLRICIENKDKFGKHTDPEGDIGMTILTFDTANSKSS